MSALFFFKRNTFSFFFQAIAAIFRHQSFVYKFRVLFPRSGQKKSSIPQITNQQGNALPIVIMFAAIGLIVAFTYIFHQLMIAKPTLYSLSSVQALFNARSGIYKAFDMIINDSLPDTLKTINTLDSEFGKDMFDSSGSDDLFSTTPVDLSVFKNDSFGNCQITLIPKGSFYELTSTGVFRDRKRVVTAKLGGKIPALPDTVLIIYNENPWEGMEPRGTRVMRSAPDSVTTSELLESLLNDYNTTLQVFDTSLLEPLLTVQSTREIDKIKDTINGSLLIDGSTSELTLKGKRTIIILGDLQIIGEVTIEEISFIVGGEIKLFDQTKAKNTSMFSKSRIFIGDYAQYNGDAIALKNITVYQNASVTDKSTLVAVGKESAPSTDSTALKTQTDSLKYSIYIEDNAKIDAVCLALGTPGTIRTGTETKISGILWAQNAICHQGTMSGLIRAARMFDCTVPEISSPPPLTAAPTDTINKTPLPAVNNTMTGSLTVLPTIKEYRMPCFTGELSIIGWKEE